MSRDSHHYYLVTGASEGIGREIVSQMLKENNSVYIMGRSLKKLGNVKKRFEKTHSGNLFLYEGNVRDSENCRKFIEAAVKKFPRIDGLVHCAGVGMRALAVEFPTNSFHEVFETNFFSALYLFKAVFKYLKATKGVFAVISSVQAEIPLPNRSAYGASKAALNSFMETLHYENPDIHFLTVMPGYVATSFSLNSLNESGERYNQMDEKQSSGMAPELAAQKVLSAMKQKKRRLALGGPLELGALWLRRAFPRVFRFLLLRQPGLK